jgi:hypothetical protein
MMALKLMKRAEKMNYIPQKTRTGKTNDNHTLGSRMIRKNNEEQVR